ncbi:MAG: hypothetical protein IPP67_09835 [Rhodospirillaceae bacterium]|nr:hypothetical protein [Rhodospirillaceae bacterium]
MPRASFCQPFVIGAAQKLSALVLALSGAETSTPENVLIASQCFLNTREG